MPDFTSFVALTPVQQAIIRLKALFFFTIPNDGFRGCLNGVLKGTKIRSNPLSRFDFTQEIDGLQKMGWLTPKNLLDPRHVHGATVEAVNHPHRDIYVQQIPYGFQAKPFYSYYEKGTFGPLEGDVCHLRLALYQNDPTLAEKIADLLEKKRGLNLSLLSLVDAFFTDHFDDGAWLTDRQPSVRRAMVHMVCDRFCRTGAFNGFIGHLLTLDPSLWCPQTAQTLSWTKILMAGVMPPDQDLSFEEGAKKWTKEEFILGHLKALAHFFAGRVDDSKAIFDVLMRKGWAPQKTANRSSFEGGLATMVHLVILARLGRPVAPAEIMSIAYSTSHTGFFRPYQALKNLAQLVDKGDVEHRCSGPYDCGHPLVDVLAALCDYWIDPDVLDVFSCQKQFERYGESLPVVGRLYGELLHAVKPSVKQYAQYLKKKGRAAWALSFIPRQEKWERSLTALTNIFMQEQEQGHGKGASHQSKRLAWLFYPKKKGAIRAVEQSQNSKGNWSKGRAVSLYQLKAEKEDLPYLIPHDHQVIDAFERAVYYGSTPIESTPALKALAGHPLVFDGDQPGVRIDLTLTQGELVVHERADGHFHLHLSSPLSDGQTIALEQETATRYQIVVFSDRLLMLQRVLGTNGLVVPPKSKDQLLTLIGHSTDNLPVRADGESLGTPVTDGSLDLCLHLKPIAGGMGLDVALFVCPLGVDEEGAVYTPGIGAPSLAIRKPDGTSVRLRRDLTAEAKTATHFTALCPVLKGAEGIDYTWTIDDPADCLEIIAYLNSDRTDGPVCHVRWPEGARLSVSKPVSASQLSLHIGQGQNWLEASGTLTIDEGTVLDLQTLLSLMDQSKGRFIPLEEGKYLALTDHFRRQLKELSLLSSPGKNGLRLNHFAAPYMRDLSAHVGLVTANDGWTKRLSLLNQTDDYAPPVPTALKATLRDYQRDGFTWLSRRASLGYGACLADDMGLGKTVQSLAVMVQEGEKGPILVVAPTSVCHNWIGEIQQFTPTLRAHTFDRVGRKDLIDNLGPMDVLICSYTLLQQEEETLSQKSFQMIVLDEAQAIKNAHTKRFQAASRLQGAFKLALSGTPIENSVADLWSLFHVITPGLLGSRSSFEKRFLGAHIPGDSGDNDSGSKQQTALKSLLNFFVLRRTKGAVLTELPPKTEQTLFIEPTQEESAFYEALRRRAVESISHMADVKAGERRLHILSEITRLRRACCHPSLVQSDITITSSKIKAFDHLIHDLLSNDHQALVFSQYVGYLKIISDHLDRLGIGYQYLDGATKPAERKKQVAAFQRGDNPLFLLSLKAGGSGLNLTAADYVIHLDPWWNPAVEDQASDRAHRMGQKRPVTVYRFIMQHSVEEKILRLHDQKRALADQLLNDSGTAASLTEAELLALLTD